MGKYEVEITEVLKKQIVVEANSKEEAENIVREQYRNEELVLSSEDCVDRNFKVSKQKYREGRDR